MSMPVAEVPRKRSGGAIVAVIFVVLAAAGGWAWQHFAVHGDGIPIYLVPAQLQAGLQRAFPVEKKELFLTVHLSDPTVELNPDDGDKIGFGANVGVSAGGRKLANGTLTAAGKLRYDAPSGSFYLDDPEIRRLDIEHVSGPEAAIIRKAVSYVLNKVIRHLAVYQLDTTDPVQRYAKRAIKSVRVRNGEVEVRLGLTP